MKKICSLFLVLALTCLVTVAYADTTDQGPGKAPHAGFQGHDMMKHRPFMSFLNLTQEQRAKMKDIWSRFKADTHDLKYDVAERRMEMRKLYTDPKADQAALMAKEKELTGLRDKLTERRFQAGLEFRSILTPEQIQKLDRMPHRGMKGRGRDMM